MPQPINRKLYLRNSDRKNVEDDIQPKKMDIRLIRSTMNIPHL